MPVASARRGPASTRLSHAPSPDRPPGPLRCCAGDPPRAPPSVPGYAPRRRPGLLPNHPSFKNNVTVAKRADVLQLFHPAVAEWFRDSFDAPTPPQREGWPAIAGIANRASARGDAFHAPDVAVRTGDTPASERARFQREPADIVITTPESLYLLLTSNAREALRSLDTAFIDEIHALVPTKRGAHLALSL